MIHGKISINTRGQSLHIENGKIGFKGMAATSGWHGAISMAVVQGFAKPWVAQRR